MILASDRNISIADRPVMVPVYCDTGHGSWTCAQVCAHTIHKFMYSSSISHISCCIKPAGTAMSKATIERLLPVFADCGSQCAQLLNLNDPAYHSDSLDRLKTAIRAV